MSSTKRSLMQALCVALVAACACQSTPNGPSVPDATTVSPSSTLRQGQDAASIVLTRAAGGLGDATAFDLGGLVVARQPQSTDTRLVLAVSVPHGAALGARTLAFTDAHGAVSIPNLLQVGAITSAPAGADTDLGTSDAPFRTLKAAIAAAGAGDTIQLLDGTYDAGAGESWSYTAPMNLAILGQSTAGTILSGSLPAGSTSPGPLGLLAPAGLTIKSLTLTAFDTAVSATGAGALEMSDVAVSGALTAAVRGDAAGVTIAVTGGALASAKDAILLGDHCASCTVDVTHTPLAGGEKDGHTVELSGMATDSHVTLSQVDIRGDISVSDATATVTVSGATIQENASDAKSTIDFGGKALDVSDSTITLAGDNFGINFAGGTLSLAGVTISGGRYGVYQLAGTAKVRGSKILDYGYMGYYLAQGDLDLGTDADAGNDVFSTTTDGPLVFGLYVDGVTRPVTSSNTTFNGVEPPAGTQSACAADPIDVPGEYFINFGKAITFWTL